MILNNYQHMSGKNSESSVIRNTLNYYGTSFKEEYIFGLDSSLGFMFYQNKNDAIDIILGKSEMFTRKSLKLLGVANEEQNSLTGVEGIHYMKKNYLSKGIPVIARVDNSILSYWDVPIEAHFGGYFVVLCGIDEDEKYVYLSDSEFDQIQKVSVEEFSAARSSTKSSPINPCNLIYVLEKPTRFPNLEKVGPVSIKAVVRNFTASPMSNMGLKGLKQFQKAMKEWTNVKTGIVTETYKNGEVKETPTLNFQLNQAGRYIEGCGTGGSCYRNMFGIFLQELNVISPRSEIEECAGLISESAKYWNEIGTTFLDVGCEDTKATVSDMIVEAVSKIDKIYGIEKNVFTTLRRL